jgi:hypothetical protein
LPIGPDRLTGSGLIGDEDLWLCVDGRVHANYRRWRRRRNVAAASARAPYAARRTPNTASPADAAGSRGSA